MAFRFRFKSLLEKREYSLREAQIAFAAARRRWEETQQRLRSLRQSYEQSWLQWQEKQQRGMEARVFLEHIHYLKSLEQQLLYLENELNEARMEMGKRQTTLLERDKEAKIMEELREREKQIHDSAILQRQQKRLDDIGVFRHLRSRPH